MGLDGGTLPTRSDILKRSSWRLTNIEPKRRSTRGAQLDPSFVLKEAGPSSEEVAEVARTRWAECSLTGDHLKEPIQCDDLGFLYNRASVVERLAALLEDPASIKKDDIGRFSHLQSLKDVFTVHLHTNPAFTSSARLFGVGSGSASVFRFACPISGVEANGRAAFVALRNCGHTFSERALNELPSKTCPTCGKLYAEADLVFVNGNAEQIEKNRIKMVERKANQKSGKKKSKGEKAVMGPSVAPPPSTVTSDEQQPPVEQPASHEDEETRKPAFASFSADFAATTSITTTTTTEAPSQDNDGTAPISVVQELLQEHITQKLGVEDEDARATLTTTKDLRQEEVRRTERVEEREERKRESKRERSRSRSRSRSPKSSREDRKKRDEREKRRSQSPEKRSSRHHGSSSHDRERERGKDRDRERERDRERRDRERDRDRRHRSKSPDDRDSKRRRDH